MGQVQLASIYLNKTLNYLSFGTDSLAVSKVIEENYTKDIHNRMELLYELLESKCSDNEKFSDQKFSLEFSRMESAKWMDDTKHYLDSLIEIINNNDRILVNKSFCERLQMYKKHFDLSPPKSKFGADSIRKHRAFQKEKNSWKKVHTRIFAEEFLIPYFQENQELFKGYMVWIQKPDTFFEFTHKGKVQKFPYAEHHWEQIKNIVVAYVDSHKNYELVPYDFYRMLDQLFTCLAQMSECDDRNEEDALIWYMPRISSFLKHHIDPSILRTIESGDTFGISKEELEKEILGAAQDIISAYKEAIARYGWTWDQCTATNSFCALEMYYLYFRLRKYSGRMRKYAEALSVMTYKKYGTFISSRAVLVPTVFLKGECYIGDAYIGEHTVLSNCKVNNHVCIGANVIIDVKHIEIPEYITIDDSVVISGNVCIPFQRNSG